MQSANKLNFEVRWEGLMSPLTHKPNQPSLTMNRACIVSCRRARKRSTFYFSSSERYEVFAAPLLLWLPEERIRDASAKGGAGAVEALTTGKGPLGKAVETALR